MRGIDFCSIPTTVLSQADSSIGGKTAVNLAGVKNIVGAFWQPRTVLIDPDTLKTLPAISMIRIYRRFSGGSDMTAWRSTYSETTKQLNSVVLLFMYKIMLYTWMVGAK